MVKISKTRLFPNMASGCKISKKSNEPILSNIQKKLIFGPKINKNGQNLQKENFPKNGVWGSLYPLMPSNFMQNMKKNLKRQF